ncbi:MAG: response regulator [Spirochaetales bacterium]|nr:response regulator [Spirochaetales bacterium]
MYNMILVDDEAIIREGISSCLPWGENGFNLIGVFEQGQEALDFIEANQVDVVLSDINMPRMNGLELSRVLGERFPHITVILLTGYDDFEYAQEAIKNQVREFLLKPITRNELSRVLETVEKELNEKRERRRIQDELQMKLDQSFPLLRERFLYRLSTGRIGREALGLRKDFFGWRDLEGFYRILLISFPPGMSDLDRLSLSEFLKERTDEDDRVFFNPDEDLVILLQDRTRDALETRSDRLSEEAFRRFSAARGRPLSIGFGDTVEVSTELARSYGGAVNGVEYSRIMGLTHFSKARDIGNREKPSAPEFNRLCNRIISGLKTGGSLEGRDAFEELLGYLETRNITEDQLKAGLIKLYYMITSFAVEIGLLAPEEEILPLEGEAFTSLERAREFFTDMIERLDRQIERRRNDILLTRIDRARAIIEERYGDSRFSLQDICDELYLSTSQFSLLFKEGTGKTFVEYLTACRMREAKNLLLSTDLKGYEVAEKVGYADPRYFSLLFKKQTGMTAMEYRRSRSR